MTAGNLSGLRGWQPLNQGAGVDPGYGVTAKVIGLTSANGRGPAARASIPGALPRPARGRWQVEKTFDYVTRGRFKVRPRDRRTVSGLRLVPGAAADEACGSGELRVRGKSRLRRATRAVLAVWIAGRRARRELDGARPVRVKAVQGGNALAGTLELSFDERRSGVGELNVPGCRLYFEFHR